MCLFLLFFKHKTAYEMRISDWSSDVCSSDLASGFAEDALLQPTLLAAFPRQMTERFQPTILAHRLRAEIVATELANRMVNRSGIVLPFALAEEEGCALGQVAAAYAVAESLFGLPRLWQAIEDAGLNPSSEERRVGKECVSTVRSRWSP